MFPYFCNNCFRNRNVYKNLCLYVGRCGHVLCTNCVKNTCRICFRQMHYVALNHQIKNGMAEYFITSTKHYRRYQRIYKFQLGQQKLYVQHFYDQQKELTKRLQKEWKTLMEAYGYTTAKLSNERERIRKRQTYLLYYEQKLTNEHNNIQTTNYPRPQPRLRYPPRKLLSADSDNLNNTIKNLNKSNNSTDNKSTDSSFKIGFTQSDWFIPSPCTPSLSITIDTSVTGSDKDSGICNPKSDMSKLSASINHIPFYSGKIMIKKEVNRSQFLAHASNTPGSSYLNTRKSGNIINNTNFLKKSYK